MCLLFVYGLAECGEAGPCRGPSAAYRFSSSWSPVPTSAGSWRASSSCSPGRSSWEDAAVPTAFGKEYAGRGGTAAARRTVQDDGAGVGEHGAGLAHAGRVDQHAPQPTRLLLGDTSEGRLVRVLRVGAAVDVDVAGTRVYEALRALDSCTALLVHRLSSSRRSGSPNRCWTLPSSATGSRRPSGPTTRATWRCAFTARRTRRTGQPPARASVGGGMPESPHPSPYPVTVRPVAPATTARARPLRTGPLPVG